MKNGYDGTTNAEYASMSQTFSGLRYSTTNPLNKGMRGLFRLEGEGFSSDLILHEKKVGEIHVHKRGEGWNVIDVYMDNKVRGKGYGKELFRDLNKKAYEEGSMLYVRERGNGGSVVLLPDGRHLLESFVRSGEAEKTDVGYRFRANGEAS